MQAILMVYQAAIAMNWVSFLASAITAFGGVLPTMERKPGQDMFTMNLIMPQKKP
jgi:hypothetical protein